MSAGDHDVSFVWQSLLGSHFEKPPPDLPFFHFSLFDLNGKTSSRSLRHRLGCVPDVAELLLLFDDQAA